MKTKFELKILNIEKERFVEKLGQIGAVKEHDEVLQRAYIMDYPDNRLWKQKAWLRLRDVGGSKVECTLKQRLDNTSIRNAQEIEVEVDDLEKAKELFEFLGLRVVHYREKKRLTYRLGLVIFDIDTWPNCRPYIEIESDAETPVWDAVEKLGLKRSDCIFTAGGESLKLLGLDPSKDIRFADHANNS